MSTRTLALFLSAFLLHTLWPFANADAQLNSLSPEALTTTTAPETRRARVPAPEEVLGFRPGDDRRLASWGQVVEYFRKLDAASDRVRFEELGRSTLGAPFVMATISAPENLARLEEFKEIQRKLADPRTLGAGADRKAARLVARGKTIVLITCGIHSNEVGSYLSSLLIAHRLASSDEPQVQEILRNCIVLLVPSLNPDGVDIVKNWYDRTLGTPFEGTDPPMLYHKYTGHDNNRDWYAFTQVETQITVDKIHNVWHPQIVNDIHQQGANGARLFLPPYMQPVEPNVPKQIIEGYTELGLAIMREMRASGFKGITNNSTYDAWTPARAYSHYHGGVRILSETASCKLATPINVKFDELRSREGYDPQKPSANFPEVWPGGEWHLRDITNYMTTAAFALLRHAAENRVRWLSRFYEIGKEAVRPRKNGELSAYVIDKGKNDYEWILVNALKRAGVEVEQAGRITIDGKARKIQYPYQYIIRLNQPYGGFAKAMIEPQVYPDLRDEKGHPIPPYDVTAHSLALLTGVKVDKLSKPFSLKEPDPEGIDSVSVTCKEILAAGTLIYRSNVPAIDEGWTRWVLDAYDWMNREHSSCEERYEAVSDEEIRQGNLISKARSIIIPDQSPRAILEGYRKGTMPDEFTGGLGAEGVKSLREFVEQGGTLVLLNRASDFAIEQFQLPVRDITAGLKRTEFYAPGSILRIEIDTSHPIAERMPKESIAWVEDSPVFEIKSDPLALARVRIIARYPSNSDPLLSGWLLGGERIKGKAALVEVGLGRGRIYLFGFRPQYRGQSLATYPLFFSAISQSNNR